MPISKTAYRNLTGIHVNRLDLKQKSQREQNDRITQLSTQPGNHAGNRDRQQIAGAMVQLLSVLSSVQVSQNRPAITPGRAEALEVSNRIALADNVYQSRIIERAIKRERMRSSAENAREANPLKTRPDAVQQPGAMSRSVDPISFGNGHRPTSIPRAATYPALMPDQIINPPVSTNALTSANSEGFLNSLQSLTNKALHETNKFIDRYDPLKFPAASASPVPEGRTAFMPTKGFILDTVSKTYIVTGEQQKNELIYSVVEHLISEGLLPPNDRDDAVLRLRAEAAGMPMTIARLDTENAQQPRRERALAAEDDPKTREHIKNHIKNHCAYEEDVLNARGENKGKLLLFQAQRAESPFRMIWDDTEEAPGALVKGVAKGLDIVTDILTLGIKPFIGNIIAAARRKEYYRNQGDEICAERQNRIIMAEVATAVDVDGLTFVQRKGPPKLKPTELATARPVNEKAAFFTENKLTGTRREILLELSPGEGASAIYDHGQKIYLKPTERANEYVTYHSGKSSSVRPERRVIVDENNLSWRYADSFDSSRLNVNYVEGKSQILLDGNYYELHKNGAGKYEIVVRTESGIKEFIPVYMEPLSRKWHLSVENGQQVFSSAQKKIIKKIHADLDMQLSTYYPRLTNSPEQYGSGKIIRVSNDNIHRNYIEMGGEYVPVRNSARKGTEEHYEVYDLKKPARRGYPVEWDGARWRFVPGPTVPASKGLRQMVDPGMFSEKASVDALSFPDRRGLRQDVNGNKYIEIKHSFIRVRGRHNHLFLQDKTGRVIDIEFKNDRFYPKNPSRPHNNPEVKTPRLKAGHSKGIKKEEAKLAKTWCPVKSVGRGLLVLPETACAELPKVVGNDITYRINLQLDEGKIHDFDVRYRGLRGMDTATQLEIKNKIDDNLFFELNKIELKQDSVDATAYESVFSDKDIVLTREDRAFNAHSVAGINNTPILTKNEKIAVRRWTAVGDEYGEVFSDGMKNLDSMSIHPMNVDINKKLSRNLPLNEDERNMVRLFDSALNKIPSQKGEYIRVSEYTDINTPWDNALKPGDIVTNFPCYMSVSADSSYIKQGTEVNADVKANVYLRFEKTHSSKPLLNGVASFAADEFESIFKRDSAFEIKQIAIADEVTSGAHALEVKKRILVTLEEVPLPQSGRAKNIHTGEEVEIRL